MHRILLATILFLAIGIHSKAQDRVFHAGLTGGISAAQVMEDGLSGFNKLGFYGGVFILSEFNKHWIGEIGMTYVMKGSKETQKQNQVYNGYKMTLGYVEFPFLIKYRANKWDFELGLSMGILVNSNEETWMGDSFSASEFQFFELAVVVGVIYTLNEKWGLNLRSSNSIIPIRYPSDNVYHRACYGQRNIDLTFAVRYFIK